MNSCCCPQVRQGWGELQSHSCPTSSRLHRELGSVTVVAVTDLFFLPKPAPGLVGNNWGGSVREEKPTHFRWPRLSLTPQTAQLEWSRSTSGAPHTPGSATDSGCWCWVWRARWGGIVWFMGLKKALAAGSATCSKRGVQPYYCTPLIPYIPWYCLGGLFFIIFQGKIQEFLVSFLLRCSPGSWAIQSIYTSGSSDSCLQYSPQLVLPESM